MVTDQFLEKVRRELSAEELGGLRAYHAGADQGSVLFMPIVRKFGQEIRWTARVHLKGAMGPLPVSKASLKAIGAPDDWAGKSRAFLDALQSEYPALPQTFPERQALPEG